MIEVSNLCKSYTKEKKTLKGISFAIKQGSITSLLGPNGAGKTTTLDIITGVKRMDSGSVIVNNIDISKDASYKETIGVMLQETQIYKKIKVKESLKLFSSFYKNKTDLTELIAKIGLKGFENRYFSTLSGGEKQKLFLGIALVNNPDLLILDEPTSALDPVSRREFWGILNSLRDEGKTILLSTHNLLEAEFLSDNIMIMQDGEIIANGSLDEVRDKLPWGKVITLTVNPKYIKEVYKVICNLEDIEHKLYTNTIEISCKQSTVLLNSLTRRFKNWDEYIVNLEVKSVPLEEVFIEVLH